MTRDEVVKGLERLLNGEMETAWAADPFVRAAIALLTPPTTDEIGAAREWAIGLQQLCVAANSGEVPTIHEIATWFMQGAQLQAETMIRALDSLAREPATEATLHRKNCRIAELEAERAEWIATVDDTTARLESEVIHVEAERDRAMDEVAVLEARLARVREVRMSLINPADINEDEYFVRVRVGNALDAALSADAEPTKERG